jgi:hypothetical protein
MTELAAFLFESGAFDEWNEWIAPVFVLLFLVDLARRILGRLKFRLQLTKVAEKWIEQKEEHELRKGNTYSGKVKSNPHPQLHMLLEELVEDFNSFRKETEESFRSVRKELDEGIRVHRRVARAELDEEVKLLRQKINDLN